MAGISEYILMKRINRRLSLSGERLHKSRRGEVSYYGEYYIDEVCSPLRGGGFPVETHVDVEATAQRLGLLTADEAAHIKASRLAEVHIRENNLACCRNDSDIFSDNSVRLFRQSLKNAQKRYDAIG